MSTPRIINATPRSINSTETVIVHRTAASRTSHGIILSALHAHAPLHHSAPPCLSTSSDALANTLSSPQATFSHRRGGSYLSYIGRRLQAHSQDLSDTATPLGLSALTEVSHGPSSSPAKSVTSNLDGNELSKEHIENLKAQVRPAFERVVKLDAFLWAAGGASGLGLITIQFIFYIISLLTGWELIKFDVVNAKANTPLSNIITLVTTMSFCIGYYRQYNIAMTVGIVPHEVDRSVISARHLLPKNNATTEYPEYSRLEHLVNDLYSKSIITTQHLRNTRVSRFLKPAIKENIIFEAGQAFYTGCTLAGFIAMIAGISETSIVYVNIQLAFNMLFGTLSIYRYLLYVKIANTIHQLTPQDPTLTSVNFSLMPKGYNKFEIALSCFLGFVQGVTLGNFIGNWLSIYITRVITPAMSFSSADAAIRCLLMAVSIYHFCRENLKNTIAMQVRITTHAQCLELLNQITITWKERQLRRAVEAHSSFHTWHQQEQHAITRLIEIGKQAKLNCCKLPKKAEFKFLLSFIAQGATFMMISIYIIGMSLPQFKGSPLNDQETKIVVFSSAAIALLFYVVQGLVVSARSVLNQKLEKAIDHFYSNLKSLHLTASDIQELTETAQKKLTEKPSTVTIMMPTPNEQTALLTSRPTR